MTASEPAGPQLRAKDAGGRWPRRIIMPLLIIVVAGVLWLWGTQREQEQAQIIKSEIREICQRIHRTRERDPSAVGREIGLPSHHVPELVERIREVIPDTPRWVEQTTIDVHVGDVGAPVNGDGAATHHVIISSVARDRLGLRIVQTGPPNDTRIIGYWVPE